MSASKDWENAYNEGDSFRVLFLKGMNKPEKFTPEILYNFAAMSIEKFFMAYFFKIKKLPYNHTMKDLTDYMLSVSDIDSTLADALYSMDDFQEICSIEHYNRKIPTRDDILTIEKTLTDAHLFIKSKLAQ
jgi:hypothetical protein